MLLNARRGGEGGGCLRRGFKRGLEKGAGGILEGGLEKEGTLSMGGGGD